MAESDKQERGATTLRWLFLFLGFTFSIAAFWAFDELPFTFASFNLPLSTGQVPPSVWYCGFLVAVMIGASMVGNGGYVTPILGALICLPVIFVLAYNDYTWFNNPAKLEGKWSGTQRSSQALYDNASLWFTFAGKESIDADLQKRIDAFPKGAFGMEPQGIFAVTIQLKDGTVKRDGGFWGTGPGRNVVRLVYIQDTARRFDLERFGHELQMKLDASGVKMTVWLYKW